MRHGPKSECEFAGGPHDGRAYFIPDRFGEFIFPRWAVAFLEIAGETIREFEARPPADGEDVEEWCRAVFDRNAEGYVPLSGFVLYRREDARHFRFAGYVTTAEKRAWARRYFSRRRRR